MPRYIDADALKEEISRIYYLHYAKTQDKTISDFFNAVAKRIKGAPTVDAEAVMHAKIVTVTDRHHMMHQRCSGCDKELEWNEYPNYCPNCGAKMDAEVQ